MAINMISSQSPNIYVFSVFAAIGISFETYATRINESTV